MEGSVRVGGGRKKEQESFGADVSGKKQGMRSWAGMQG